MHKNPRFVLLGEDNEQEEFEDDPVPQEQQIPSLSQCPISRPLSDAETHVVSGPSRSRGPAEPLASSAEIGAVRKSDAIKAHREYEEMIERYGGLRQQLHSNTELLASRCQEVEEQHRRAEELKRAWRETQDNIRDLELSMVEIRTQSDQCKRHGQILAGRIREHTTRAQFEQMQ